MDDVVRSFQRRRKRLFAVAIGSSVIVGTGLIAANVGYEMPGLVAIVLGVVALLASPFIARYACPGCGASPFHRDFRHGSAFNPVKCGRCKAKLVES